MGNSSHYASIHILDDDSLLNVFVFIGRSCFMEMRITRPVSRSWEAWQRIIGTWKNGGTSSCTFAKDGEILYLGQHPTSVFASSIGLACPLQTC